MLFSPYIISFQEPGCGHQFHHHLSISEKIIFVQTEMKDSDVDVTSVDEVPVLSTLGLDRGFDKSEGAGFMLRGQVLAAQLNHQRIVIYFVMAAQEESELRSQNEQTVQSQPSQSHHNVVHFSWKAGTQCENSARRHCVAPKVFYTSSKSDSVKENLRRVYCIVLEIQASAPQVSSQHRLCWLMLSGTFLVTPDRFNVLFHSVHLLCCLSRICGF